MPYQVQIFDELQPLVSQDWLALFGRHPDPPELISLAGIAGLKGFTFKNIVVRFDGELVLSLPIFCGQYPVAMTLDSGWLKTLISSAEHVLPWLFRPRFIAIGFIEGEWGQVGVNRMMSQDVINTAWSLATNAFQKLASRMNAGATVLWNFTEATLADIPQNFASQYTLVPSQPYCTFDVRWSSLSQYLASLPKDMRRYLQRVQKRAGAVTIEHATTPGADIERIYELYLAQVARSDLAFGVQSKQYFAEICDKVPGAEYVLFKLEGELVAFEVVIERDDVLVSKYFAMEPEIGAQYWLYFVSWLHQVDYCIQKRIPEVYLGSASEGIKSKLGCATTPSFVLFKHRNPLLNAVLNHFRDELAYNSDSPDDKQSVSANAAESGHLVGCVKS